MKVERENGARMVVVRANVRGRDLVGFVADAQAAVARQVPLPTGYRIGWGGQFENQQRAAARLALVVPVALGLIFGLLFATLGSVRQALLVLANIPLALVGGVVALAVTGEYLSVPASVGFIALMGIAVLNGLVMITHFNQLHARGQDLATVVGKLAAQGLQRLRQIACGQPLHPGPYRVDGLAQRRRGLRAADRRAGHRSWRRRPRSPRPRTRRPAPRSAPSGNRAR